MHDGLGLWVAKTAVVLDDRGIPVCIDHEPCVQKAGIGVSFCRHALHGGQNHPLHHCGEDGVGHNRRGGVGTHAAGIGAGIALTNTFVILRGGHGQHVLAIDHHDKARLLALKKAFHDNPRAGVTELVIGEHVVDGHLGFILRHCHNHPFPRGEAVGLDDDRCALLSNIGQSRLDVGKHRIGCGGDVVPREKILGKGFAALQLRRTGGGAKAGQVEFGESVHNPGNQWRLGTDNGQCAALLPGKFREAFNVHGVEWHILEFWFECRAGVTWRDVNPLDRLGFSQLPRQRVLAPATPHNQNIHTAVSL